ncbi:uncharacterized protein LOC127093801 [Lathyrus oleraceus]|uniref:uncharacterized protein LOC127093801 n=1 Tax=Pisum sativum TaxID=3888 RepID=UPI0021D1D678|nr:uncharacterized protein LOC127093801 [Pisum sativum]
MAPKTLTFAYERLKKIVSKEVIRGVPKLKIKEGKIYVESLGGKRYAYVVVDDFSRFTWVNFIKEKSDVFEVFKDSCKRLQREKQNEIVRIISDHGKEFENRKFAEFCSFEIIGHEFSSPITPQQNGVIELKNRTLQESARVMLHVKRLPYHFWDEAMNIACYIHNRVTLRTGTESEVNQANKGPSIIIQKDRPKELIIGNLNEGITTRSREVVSNSCFVSKFEPKNVKEALIDKLWINDMQEELGQFKRNVVWDLVHRPEGTNVIGTKWVYNNKSDEKCYRL